MKISDLPKFDRVLGWDTSSSHLKKLKLEMADCKKKDSKVVMLEGKRIILDAMEAGFYPKTFVFSRLNLLEKIPFDTTR